METKDQYARTGSRLPSVTQIISAYLYPDKKPTWFTDIAQVAGMEAHAMIEADIRGKRGYITDWFDMVGFTPTHVEKRLYCNSFSGQLDLFGNLRGGIPCLVDHKNKTGTPRDYILMQMYGYRTLLIANGMLLLSPDLKYVLHTISSKTFFPIPSDEVCSTGRRLWEVALATFGK